jgi:hypothetical protein
MINFRILHESAAKTGRKRKENSAIEKEYKYSLYKKAMKL